MAALIDELQGVGLEPGDFAERAEGAGDYERELARLFSGYAEVRDELAAATPTPSRAELSLACAPAAMPGKDGPSSSTASTT